MGEIDPAFGVIEIGEQGIGTLINVQIDQHTSWFFCGFTYAGAYFNNVRENKTHVEQIIDIDLHDRC